jgi:putative DNA primase/helicase
LSVRKELPFRQVNELALGQYPDILHQWFPNGKLVDGRREFAIGDLSGTPGGKDGGSVKVNIHTGAWAEMNGGEPAGNDPVSLYAWAFCGGKMGVACRQLGCELGVPGCEPPKGANVVPFVPRNPPREAKKEDWKPIVPPPDGVGEPQPILVRWDHVYRYLDRSGRLLRYVVRNDAKGDDAKVIRPLTYGLLDGKPGWYFRGPDDPKSLYGLELLDERDVLLQEGEWKTKAARDLLPEFACLSLTGGTGGKNCNDLMPLAGLRVFCCPDADPGGREAMVSVADQLRALGCKVFLVDQTGMPDKWDLGNAVKDGWDAERIREHLRARTVENYAADPLDEGPDFPQEEDDAEWKDDSSTPNKRTLPPIPLGYDSGHYYYLSPMTGQIEVLARRSHTKPELIGIADLQWYNRLEQFKGTRGGLDWDAIGNMLKGWCSDVGFYDPDRVRGRGAWMEDDGRPVFNVGDRLIVSGESLPLKLPGSRYFYEAAPRLNYAPAPPLTKEDTCCLLELCKLFNWEKPISATLLAGWIVTAIICGALPWRPAIWVSGGSGSGKTTLERLIIKPALKGIGLFLKNGTTEAGIRQKLKQDARPLVFDEAEAENPKSKATLQGLLDLNRQSSSEGGAEIVKGTQNQTGAKHFHVKSSFMFSSINPMIDHRADESRITVLELKNPVGEEIGGFDAVVDRAVRTMTPEFRAGLVARAVWLMPVILKNIETFSKAVSQHLSSARVGDQIGTMLAGAYALEEDGIVSPEMALKRVREEDWGDTTSADSLTDERRLLNHLMQRRVRLDKGEHVADMTLAELVLFASDEPPPLNDPGQPGSGQCELLRNGLKYESDPKVFERNGIVFDDDETQAGFWVSNTHTALRKHLEGTPWSSQWWRTLHRLPGTGPLKREEPGIKFAGELARATFVPLKLIGG